MQGLADTTDQSEETGIGGLRSPLVLRGLLPTDRSAIVLSGSGFTAGRAEECEFRISGADVSRRHFEVFREGPIYAVKDLRSTNGIRINGRRVQQSALSAGMLLRAGDWLGLVEAEAESRPCGVEELCPGLFGGSLLASVIEPLKRAATSKIPIVLVGATGTGKEVLARAIHHLSGRAGAFQAINCAALPAALAEGELFGYKRDALAVSERERSGQFRAAHAGTLFLDDVAGLTLSVQAKLLRAVELGEVTPLGETVSLPFDARLVVATQTPLEELVAQGSFRNDLAARLAGLTVRLPTLAARKADIPALFWYFLREHSGGRPPQVSTKLFERLCLHDWPGNVRELLLLARQLLAVHGAEPFLRRSHLPQELQGARPDVRDSDASELSPREEDRSEYDLRRLRAAIRESGGNVTLAAQRSGISRQRAYRLMAREDRSR